MPARLVNIDRDTPLLLPPDLRDWVPQDHLSHYIIDVVDGLPLTALHLNERGTGKEQFPPRMMLALLIYCYASGTFSSRAIERATYTDVAVRYLSGDTHPDHDTICAFRRQNQELLSEAFVQVLETAREMKLLKVGQICLAVDGTKVLANASKHSAVSYQRAGEQIALLQQEVAELMAKAEQADSTPLADGLSIPDEIKRREDRMAKLREARAVLERRARERAAAQQPEYEAKMAAREAKKQNGQRVGKKPKPPVEQPGAKDQYNFTDPESRIMKAGNGAHYEQAYNAQAAVDVDSRLIVGERVSDAANDKQQLVPTLAAVSEPVKPAVETVLVDSGFYSEEAVREVEAEGGPTVYAAMEKTSHHRRVADLEKRADPSAPGEGATMAERMRHRMKTAAGRAIYRLRQQSVEPVFGIIKEAMGFRRFGMRGLAGAGQEWTLVCVAYNVRRLYRMKLAMG